LYQLQSDTRVSITNASCKKIVSWEY